MNCRKDIKIRMRHIASQVFFKNEQNKKSCHLAGNVFRSCNLENPSPYNSCSSMEDLQCLYQMNRNCFQTTEIQGMSFPFVQCSVIFPTEKNPITWFILLCVNSSKCFSGTGCSLQLALPNMRFLIFSVISIFFFKCWYCFVAFCRFFALNCPKQGFHQK